LVGLESAVNQGDRSCAATAPFSRSHDQTYWPIPFESAC